MLDSKFANGKTILVIAESPDGTRNEFPVSVRIDTPQEILYYQHGGILQYVLRQVGWEKRIAMNGLRDLPHGV